MLVFVMSTINVLYCFDNNFWRLAMVSIASLINTQKCPENVVFYCMVAPHTRGHRKITKLVSQAGGRVVWRVVRLRENPYRGYDYSRWSPVIFYRLFAYRVFPELDKILYLDSDTLICSDLTKLYDTDISKYAMGAVSDMALLEKSDKNFMLDREHVRFFMDTYLSNKLYINSGVLLMNLSNMRAHESDLLNVCAELKYPDQDILNIALNGRIRELPLKFNMEPSVETKYKLESPVICHFYAVKPYIYGRVIKLHPRLVFCLKIL